MRTTVAWAVVSVIGLAASANATAGVLASSIENDADDGAAYPFIHVGRHTDLEYEYDTIDDREDGDVTRFRIHTTTGHLSGRLVVGEPFSRIVLRHESSGAGLVADCVAAERPDEWDVHLRLTGREGEAYLRVAEDLPSGLVTLVREGFDCATGIRSELRQARREALRQIRFEQEVAGRSPAHLQQIEAALWFAGAAEDVARNCPSPQEPEAGACHLDYDTYQECFDCCEAEASLFNVTCNLVHRALCKAPWCKKLGQVVCGGLTSVHADACVDVMCNGKAGDPSCNPAQDCGEIEGSSCWEFCGITQKSVCGRCDPGQSCCKPI